MLPASSTLAYSGRPLKTNVLFACAVALVSVPSKFTIVRSSSKNSGMPEKKYAAPLLSYISSNEPLYAKSCPRPSVQSPPKVSMSVTLSYPGALRQPSATSVICSELCMRPMDRIACSIV